MLCIHSFGVVFFWRKCSTVVAVGVQTSFCLWVDWLIDFLRNKKKQCAKLCEDCKKCDRKKTTAGLIARRQAKRLCKPRGTRGEDFCLPGITPAELSVINDQVKPDLGFLKTLY